MKLYEDEQIIELRNALSLFVLDPRLYNWLKANDPKALQQVQDALGPDVRPLQNLDPGEKRRPELTELIQFTVFDCQTHQRVSDRLYGTAEEAGHDYHMNQGHTYVGVVKGDLARPGSGNPVRWFTGLQRSGSLKPQK